MVVLRWNAVDVDELLLARDALHQPAFALGIKELFTVRARHICSIVDEDLLAQAVEVHLAVGAEAVNLVRVHAVEVAHLVVWRQRLQLGVAEANILNVL